MFLAASSEQGTSSACSDELCAGRPRNLCIGWAGLESSEKAGLQHLLRIEVQKSRSRNCSRRSNYLTHFDGALEYERSTNRSTRCLLPLYPQLLCYHGFQHLHRMLTVSLTTFEPSRFRDDFRFSLHFSPLDSSAHPTFSPIPVLIRLSSPPLYPLLWLSISLSW